MHLQIKMHKILS